MKIAVNGVRIDTEDIYDITSIKRFDYYTKNCLNLQDTGGYLSFKILLYDKPDLVIVKSDNKSSKCLNNKSVLELITEFRKLIIDEWNKNPSKIPTFNL